MTKSAVLFVMFGLFLACPDPSLAVPTILLSESLDSENGGLGVLDYSGFGSWTVSDGTVDLIGNGSGDLLPGNGLYIDLDASTRSAGKITAIPIYVKPGQYASSVELAGRSCSTSEYGYVASDIVNVEIAGDSLSSKNYRLQAGYPFCDIHRGLYSSRVGIGIRELHRGWRPQR